MSLSYEVTNWENGKTVLKAEHLRKIEKGITDIISENDAIYKDEDIRKSNEKQRQEEHLRKMNEVSEVVSDIQKDYDSLQKIIIDENASANLQKQINSVNSQLEHKANKMQTETDIKALYSLKSEKSTTDSLQSQINNLVLNSGGDSNLEVVQSRTNSVGSIFYNSKNHIDNIEKAIFNKIDRKYSYKWVIGTTNAETGGTAANNTRITTDNIVYADNDLTIM